MSESSIERASIVVKKVVKAPRDKVYQAWIDPEQRKKWWKAAPEYTGRPFHLEGTGSCAYPDLALNWQMDGCRPPHHHILHTRLF